MIYNQKKDDTTLKPSPAIRQTWVESPQWEEEYYLQRQKLEQIQILNKRISQLVDQYALQPSAYTSKQLEQQIKKNCSLMDEVEAWATRFSYSPSGAKRKVEENMNGHIMQMLKKQINTIFISKNKINDISRQIEIHERSFNTFEPSRSINHSRISQRQDNFREINDRISNLNIIMRRIASNLTQQGQLVDRIDENMTSAKYNVEGGRDLLVGRAKRQEGQTVDGEFTCEGRVNKVICGLYLLNLTLVAVFILKNFLF